MTTKDTKILDAAWAMRYQNSPYLRAVNGLTRAVRAHKKAGVRVGDNKATNQVFYYAEELTEIEDGVLAGRLGPLGYPKIETESEG